MNLEEHVGIKFGASDYVQFQSWNHVYELGQQVSYGEMKRTPYPDWDETMYVELPLTGGSDYSGATYTRSNYLVLAEDENWEALREEGIIVTAYGGYDTYAIFIALNIDTQHEELLEELIDVINDLEDYLIIDEDHLGELELELEEEDWYGYTGREFWAALETMFEETDPDFERFVSDMQFDEVYDVWRAACDKSNTYPVWECLSIYWDFDSILEVITKEFITENM